MPTPDQLKDKWPKYIEALMGKRVTVTDAMWDNSGKFFWQEKIREGKLVEVYPPASIFQKQNEGVINILHIVDVPENREGMPVIGRQTSVDLTLFR